MNNRRYRTVGDVAAVSRECTNCWRRDTDMVCQHSSLVGHVITSRLDLPRKGEKSSSDHGEFDGISVEPWRYSGTSHCSRSFGLEFTRHNGRLVRTFWERGKR